MICGDGEQSRDFTFIDNVVHANLLAAHAPLASSSTHVVNIATNSRTTLNEAVSILRDLTGYTGEVKFGLKRSGDIRHSLADIQLAEECIRYKVIVNFREGLRR